MLVKIAELADALSVGATKPDAQHAKAAAAAMATLLRFISDPSLR
jgi:hypothetical protein